MKVLLLGYSSIARRRVLPALHAAGVESVDVASTSAGEVAWPGRVAPRLFRDYDAALSESDADVVYISTVNSLHAPLARKALGRGFHVAVDKPAFLSLEETGEILAFAARNQRCLAEATVYQYHPRIALAFQAFEEAGSRPTHAVAVFSFPPLPPEDFRQRAALGGGALLDLGRYALTPGRIFFGAPPLEVTGRRLSDNGEVDTGFSLTAVYEGGRSLVGTFTYTTGYMNRLDLLGPGVTVTLDRVFSPPPDMTTELIVRRAGGEVRQAVAPADTFALFFRELFAAVAGRDYERFAAPLLEDARAFGRLQSSALATADASS